MIKRSSRRRPAGGFTLIEVLLVLVILVVLASLAVVSIGPIQRKMKINSAKAQIGLLASAVETYNVDVGSYPMQLDALRVQPGDLAPGKWAGPYLNKDVPLDPWDHQYQYSSPGQHNQDSFDVWTVTPLGQEIGNWTENVGR